MTQTALITGATSGIGRAIAQRLAKVPEMSLILCGRDHDRLRDIERLARSSGCNTATISADLANDEGIADIVSAIAMSERVETIVHCAGLGRFGTVEEIGSEEFDRMIRVNLRAPYLLTRHCLPFLENAGRSRVVFLGSDAEEALSSGSAIYAASKAGLKAMVRNLQLEVAPSGVNLVLVSPGRVDTHFNGRNPGDRPGALSPEDVATAVVSLIAMPDNIEVQNLRLDSMARMS